MRRIGEITRGARPYIATLLLLGTFAVFAHSLEAQHRVFGCGALLSLAAGWLLFLVTGDVKISLVIPLILTAIAVIWPFMGTEAAGKFFMGAVVGLIMTTATIPTPGEKRRSDS